MTRIIPEELSDTYRVINADDCDFEKLYELFRSNSFYFEYFSLAPTREELRADMTMLPDGCTGEQKHFVVYFDGDRPTAILDLIEGYPDEHTCYIGLFMVHASLAGQGIGTAIITDLCRALRRLGFTSVRLAYGRDYARAKQFWTKNGFVPLREASLEKYGELIVAERSLGIGGNIRTRCKWQCFGNSRLINLGRRQPACTLCTETCTKSCSFSVLWSFAGADFRPVAAKPQRTLTGSRGF